MESLGAIISRSNKTTPSRWSKEQIINAIRSYKSYMNMFRTTGTDNYLHQAIDIYNKTNKQLAKYNLVLKRLHRASRRIK